MEGSHSLYLMISRTDTWLGRVIRCVSRYPYNHVSLALDSNLQTWYSFARYVQDAPFYGGFVTEPAERFLANGYNTQVQIFRLDLSPDRAAELERYFAAGKNSTRLLYNYYDALVCILGLHVPIPDAHTCLSFACGVLNLPCRSIRDLAHNLQPYLIYEGSYCALAADSGCRDDRYFTNIGLLRGTACAAGQLGILSCRLLVHSFNGHMANRFHHTAQ